MILFTKKIVQYILYVIFFVLLSPLILLSFLRLIRFESGCLLISLIPGLIGVYVRRVWYNTFLRSCGANLEVEFLGSIITKKAIIGDNVSVGKNSSVGACTLGNNITISNNCGIMSGKSQHTFFKNELINRQFGKGIKKNDRIVVEDDCFIGMNSVIGANLAKGTVVGANSFVNKTFKPYSIIGGVPAQFLKTRPKKN